MRSIAFIIVLACFLPIAQAITTLGITDVGPTTPTFLFSGPTAFTGSEFWWWGLSPALSAVCVAGATCDTTVGGLSLTGTLYNQPGYPGPFGFPGATIENFINIYEPDGVTLSDTLQIILHQNQARVYFPTVNKTFTIATVEVQEIFLSNPAGAYTATSSAPTACVAWTGGTAGCTISSITEDGTVQNIISVPAASIGFGSNFQSETPAVPEPMSFILVGSALAFFGIYRRKKLIN